MKQQQRPNNRGFSHHFLLPLLAIVVVGAIGVLTLNLSSAASTTKQCTAVTFGRYKNNPVNYPQYKPCVKAIQKKVGTTADGIYGNNTLAHVKTWQKNHGLTADGVVGPKTWAKMGIHPTYTVTTTKTTAEKKKACNAKYGYVWSSNSKACYNMKKVCSANDGTWSDAKKKCTYKTSSSSSSAKAAVCNKATGYVWTGSSCVNAKSQCISHGGKWTESIKSCGAFSFDLQLK